MLVTQKVNELVFKATIIGVINRLSQPNTIRFSQSDRVSAANDGIVVGAGNNTKSLQSDLHSLIVYCFLCANS